MAVQERHRSGRGQSVEVALLDTALTLMHPFAVSYLMSGVVPTPVGNRHPMGAPFDLFPVRDGHVIMCIINNRQFRKLCTLLGKPDLASDPRFVDNGARVAHVDALGDELAALLKDWTKMELSMAALKAYACTARSRCESSLPADFSPRAKNLSILFATFFFPCQMSSTAFEKSFSPSRDSCLARSCARMAAALAAFCDGSGREWCEDLTKYC